MRSESGGQWPGARWMIHAGARFRHRFSPPQLFVLSFAGLIAFGTVGLLVLPGLYVGPRLGFVDALFTATSAVCVTGLIVVDTATYFTPAGQAFLLLLIQLGGLGMITLTTLIIITLGRRLSLVQQDVALGAAAVSANVDYVHLARSILIFTFVTEVIGALLLWTVFARSFGTGPGLWHAFFQSISALCNAGFSTFSDSLTSFRESPVVLTTVMSLIVLGGLGFLVVDEIYLAVRAHWRAVPYRLSLHTRLVVSVTLILLVGGWIAFTLSEWNHTLAELPLWARAANGLFMSVTARTAGFNTIDHAVATDGTNFMTILLMAIGGSPGSMAGGIKTTTIALIGLLALARLRGDRVVSYGSRSVPDETVQRAVGLFAAAFGVMALSTLLLTYIETGVDTTARSDFLTWMFEAVSAFNTVGLSMGATSDLPTSGRLLMTALMFTGRVGPLTFAAAIALRARGRGFRYAHENVVIG